MHRCFLAVFRFVRRPCFLAVIFVWLTAGHLSAQVWRDDFTAYGSESDGSPNWEALESGWFVNQGGFEGQAGLASWNSVPWARALIFSCDLTVLEQGKGEWLTAGIALCADEQNFWALNLVAAPEKMQRRHSAELQEMLRDTWLAETQPENRLEPIPMPMGGGSPGWQTGETYHLELSLTTSNIIGRIFQEGRVAQAFGWRFKESIPAVRAGRPAVIAKGLRVRVTNASVTVNEQATPPPPAIPAHQPWVSRPGRPLAPGTGFFRVAELDGRWWLLDPEGKPFFDVGTDHINYLGHWCEKLGYSPYHRNVEAKYGSEAAWGSNTLARLQTWGFNTLPAGHSLSLRHQGLPHILFASFGASFASKEWICEPIHWTGFPDVFSPRWESHCRVLARKLARESRGDPWCLGAFLDNELEWYGKHGQLVDEVFQNPGAQASKQALWSWLQKRFGSLTEINHQLGTRYADAPAFLAATNVPSVSAGLEIVRQGFLAEIAERYFSVPSRALREADPEHMVLGCRFAGRVPVPVLGACGRYNDVFTFNTYPRVDFENVWQPDGTGGVVERVPREFAELYAVVKRPFIITEWSFPALDSGLPCTHGAGMRVDTQEQKAACYRIFANAMCDLPFVVGQHYFMWADQPAPGISASFPEDSNYGLVNEQDAPYEPFVKVVTEVNRQSAERHARSRASGSLALEIAGTELLVINTNAIPSHGRVRLVARGQSEIRELALNPGERRPIAVPSNTWWSAELQNWDGVKIRRTGAPKGPGAEKLGLSTLAGVPIVVDGSVPQGIFAPGGVVQSLTKPAGGLQKAARLEIKSTGTTWICEGRDGSLFDGIRAGELPLGRLVFALHQEAQGQQGWNESTRVRSLEVMEQPDAWLVEAEVERPGAGGFRARVQALVFKGLDLAMVRPLWVENTDTHPWRLVEAFWFCRSAIGGSSRDDIVAGPQVPNYYWISQYITDRNLGGCFGALDDGEAWRVRFWTDSGGIHPDSHYEVIQDLAPGQRWEPGRAPFLWVFASAKPETAKEMSRLQRASHNQ